MNSGYRNPCGNSRRQRLISTSKSPEHPSRLIGDVLCSPNRYVFGRLCRHRRTSATGAIGVERITQPYMPCSIGEVGILRDTCQPVFPVPEGISSKAIILEVFALIPELQLSEQTVGLGDREDRLHGMGEQKRILADTHIVEGILEPAVTLPI